MRVKCSPDVFPGVFGEFEGFATTPCSKKYPHVNLVSPGCYDDKTIEIQDFKRNVPMK